MQIILHAAVPYIILKVLTWGFRLTIKSFFTWGSFLLFSRPQSINQSINLFNVVRTPS